MPSKPKPDPSPPAAPRLPGHPLSFGKYSGWTLPEVMRADPFYARWLTSQAWLAVRDPALYSAALVMVRDAINRELARGEGSSKAKRAAAPSPQERLALEVPLNG